MPYSPLKMRHRSEFFREHGRWPSAAEMRSFRPRNVPGNVPDVPGDVPSHVPPPVPRRSRERSRERSEERSPETEGTGMVGESSNEGERSSGGTSGKKGVRVGMFRFGGG